MQRQTLKTLRTLIPGLILVIEFLPLLKELKVEFEMGSGWLDYGILSIVAFGIGAVYNISRLRELVTKNAHRKIDLNITSSLLKIYNRTLTQVQRNFLKEKRLKHVFYKLVDNDASLTAKSEIIYFNGLLWTSAADLFLLSLFSSFVYIMIGLLLSMSAIWPLGLLFAVTSVIGLGLYFLTVFRHINLSNDQLEFIETHYVTELNTKLDDVLQQMP